MMINLAYNTTVVSAGGAGAQSAESFSTLTFCAVSFSHLDKGRARINLWHMDYIHMGHQYIWESRQHFVPLAVWRQEDYSSQISNNHFLARNKILQVQPVKILQCAYEEQRLEDHLVS
jgi:hypothetical protein